MAETTDQIRAEIAATRDDLAATIDEIAIRVEATKRRIPFYGMERRQMLMIAGGAAAALAGVAFMAFYARNRLSAPPVAVQENWLERMTRRLKR
jgi:hypothetical protein